MLIVENLEYRYGSYQVLWNLSCQLKAHQVGMLIGQNGAGKSTFLRCIAGWSVPYEGVITVNNVSLSRDERHFRRQVILVPDTPDFYDELTAWEHLQLIGQLHQIPNWTAEGEKLLNSFDLFEHRHAFPFTFSRGMRYKLALCLAFLAQPPLLVLDEPFGPLDATAVEKLWRLLKEFAEAGGTVLFSSHTIGVHQLPDIILHLHQGQINMVQPSTTIDLAELLGDVS